MASEDSYGPVAFCPNGHVSRIAFINAPRVEVEFGGHITTRCPECGTVAEVPSGTYDFVSNTVDLIAAPGMSPKRLATLERVITQVLKDGLSGRTLKELIDAEAPELSPMIAFAPKDAPALAAYLMVILLLIQTIHGWKQDGKTMTPSDVQRVVTAVIDAQKNAPQTQRPPARQSSPPAMPSSHPDAPASPATPLPKQP